MKKVIIGIVLAGIGMQTAATESRPLSDSEEAELKKFASEKAGVDVWHVQSSVMELETQNEAMAKVVFEPASAPEYCLAPSATFMATSSESGSFVWQSPENARVHYLFWFEPCDTVNWESAITLRELLDFDVLERIRNQSAPIIVAMEKRLGLDRQGIDPTSAVQLNEIDLRYDKDQGPVYHIEYSLGHCFWISADVIFESGRARVLDAWRVVC